VHEQGLIHKDIKQEYPGGCGKRRRVADGFGIGLPRLPARAPKAPAPPEVIVGTLAYMAPEQTGRI